MSFPAPDLGDAVPSIYLDPYQYDLLAQLTAPDDLVYYRRLVERWGGPLLEIGCGTGRVCLPLALEGLSVTGIDRSEPMITAARRKATAARIDIDLQVADLRSLDLGRTFKLVIVPYNTFNHLETLDDIQRGLASIRGHMDRSSRLAIDTFTPDPAELHLEPVAPRKILEYVDPLSKQRIRLFEQSLYLPDLQLNKVTWRYEVDGRRDARVERFAMRIFFPQELDALLAWNGFEIVEKRADYDGTPFGAGAVKQLLLCARRG